jgi:hypothetical protein
MKFSGLNFDFKLFAFILLALKFNLISSDAETVFKLSANNVVKITTYNELNRVIKTGSGVVLGRSKSKLTDHNSRKTAGFIISNSNGDDIISNFHVVAFASKIIVESKSGKKTEAGIVYFDSESDIAILRTGEKLSESELKIASKLNVGQKVFTIGNPSGLDWSISDGIISGFRTNNVSGLIQFTAPISAGSSGGGLFDSDGNLIGITTSQIINAQSLNFAINLVNHTDFDNEIIRNGGLIHPDELVYDNWAIGYFYQLYPGANEKYGMLSNKNLILWYKYKTAIDLITDQLYLDKNSTNGILKFKRGMATGKEFVLALLDAKDLLLAQRSVNFKYDVIGSMEYSYCANGESEIYTKYIESLKALHGNILCVYNKYLINLNPQEYNKENLPKLQKQLLDLVHDIPLNSKDGKLDEFVITLSILCSKYKLVELDSFLKSKGY